MSLPVIFLRYVWAPILCEVVGTVLSFEDPVSHSRRSNLTYFWVGCAVHFRVKRSQEKWKQKLFSFKVNKCIFFSPFCTVFGRVSPSQAVLPMDVSILWQPLEMFVPQQPKLPQDVSVLYEPLLLWTCLFYGKLCYLCVPVLQLPVLPVKVQRSVQCTPPWSERWTKSLSLILDILFTIVLAIRMSANKIKRSIRSPLRS